MALPSGSSCARWEAQPPEEAQAGVAPLAWYCILWSWSEFRVSKPVDASSPSTAQWNRRLVAQVVDAAAPRPRPAHRAWKAHMMA